MNQNLEDEINETLLKESGHIHAIAIGFFLALTYSLGLSKISFLH
jgi:hypothetical protein